MTIFADASAPVAILAREPDALDLSDCLRGERDRLCSAPAAWETLAGLCRSHAYAADTAREDVRALLEALRFRLAPVGHREYDLAADAYARFGKGRHPAGLNMGDCFAYACAKANDAKLLFKGEDFARTDVRPAYVAAKAE